jgi:hypothetical protein
MTVEIVRLEVRALIPRGPVFAETGVDPLHGPLDAVDPLGAIALGVGVLDTQDERATVLAGVDPVVERGLGPTDVEVARR